MLLKVKISKEQLKNLYQKENLTTFEIADKLGCCQATIWKKLKEFNIKLRLPGVERVNLTKEQLEDLYINKKLSTWSIERKLNISRGTIHRKLKKFNIKSRDRSDSHIIYSKTNFSGDLIEKAYLIGFRIGDLGVRKVYTNSKIICVASGSTIDEQIELINNLLKNYGKVWIKKTKNGRINIQVFLNLSFEFLLSKEFPSWVEKDKQSFFSFLAGFSDAEGHIGLSNNMAYFSLGNYDSKLLFILYENLNKFGINCNKPLADNRKGKVNNQGYKYNSNYYTLRIHKKSDLLKFLLEIKPYLKHGNKVKDLNRAILNIEGRNKIK